ncbi:MAG: 5'-3' exonuclease H3TH domain-containing protein [Acidobacteriota bacterium]
MVEQTVYLIDSSPYIFRAFFSLPSSMRDGEGRPVNAVYGFASFLIRLITEEEPSHLAATFDGRLSESFRNDLYSAYKAQREAPPQELKDQIGLCREIAEALGVATLIDMSYEADDLCGTLAARFAEQGHRAVVVTSDKDLAQLVTDRVSLYDFAKGSHFGPAEVREKFDVAPEQIADYLGLAGDAVDNIPGVPGIGKKTAAALLQGMGTLDAALDRLDEVAELPLRGAKSLAKKLTEHRDQALLSRQLATIVTDAPVAAEMEDLELRGASEEKVDPLFERLGFGATLRDRIPAWA